MLNVIGTILGICLVMFLIFKGWHMGVVSLLAYKYYFVSQAVFPILGFWFCYALYLIGIV